jgi:hypothetical protein
MYSILFHIFHILNFANSKELFQPCLLVELDWILILKSHLQFVCYLCVCARMCVSEIFFSAVEIVRKPKYFERPVGWTYSKGCYTCTT